ncbi:hypothetical protein ACN38_g9017 [Penicillium nordicum]|uniref:Uncharacterized protein n=1 Tax=Penicillium nordicum TaxID=229535 RepID=A0A0M8NVB8_9EURO|nr:hypothetical protein ACN38_g9017 [Penicillium nordicum]
MRPLSFIPFNMFISLIYLEGSTDTFSISIVIDVASEDCLDDMLYLRLKKTNNVAGGSHKEQLLRNVAIPSY